ncbi:MAG: hypothetical protein AAB437_02580 [Patescibacteria group bacterium]
MTDLIKKQNGVLWLDKTGLSLYLENKAFLRLNCPPEIINDLEIVDKLKLQNLIHSFVNQNNLSFLSLIVIITAEVLFEKDWNLPQTDTQLKEEEDFFDSIPFENVLEHSWIKDNKKKLIATNQDLITALRDCFEKENCNFMAVFPYSLFGAGVRDESAKEIWKKLDSFKHNNLIEEDKVPNKEKSLINSQINRNENRSLLPILIAVFVILIGVLVFFLIKNSLN